VNVTCLCGAACRCCLPGAETHFSALLETDRRFSALLETDRRFSALLETDRRFSALLETGSSALMEADARVRLLLHCRFLGVRGVIDSCGGCDAVSTATYAASAVSEMGACGDALSKTTCAASAVSEKCQRRGPVSSRHPASRESRAIKIIF